jgi:hypothetical protein
MGEMLVCPQCESEHDGDERFCPECGMPLVHGGAAEATVTERQQRARRIRPEYAQGALVKATYARNQAEAELIAGMLLAEGIPSLIRRSAAFDVPDFMAAGPRDVLVPQSGLAAARDVLLQTGPTAAARRPRPPGAGVSARTRIAASLLLAIALVAIVLFMATHVWD